MASSDHLLPSSSPSLPPCPRHPHSRIVGVCSSCLTDKLVSLSCAGYASRSSFTIVAAAGGGAAVIRREELQSDAQKLASCGGNHHRISIQQSCEIKQIHDAAGDLFDINLEKFHGRIIEQKVCSISDGIREHLHHRFLGSNDGMDDGRGMSVDDKDAKKRISCDNGGILGEADTLQLGEQYNRDNQLMPDSASSEIRVVEPCEKEIRTDAAKFEEQRIRAWGKKATAEIEEEIGRRRYTERSRRRSAEIRMTLRDLFAMHDAERKEEKRKEEGMENEEGRRERRVMGGDTDAAQEGSSASAAAKEVRGLEKERRYWWKMRMNSSRRSNRESEEETVSCSIRSNGEVEQQRGRGVGDTTTRASAAAMAEGESSDDERGGGMCRPLGCCSSSRASSPAVHVIGAAENNNNNRMLLLRRSRSCGAAIIFNSTKQQHRRQQSEQSLQKTMTSSNKNHANNNDDDDLPPKQSTESQQQLSLSIANLCSNLRLHTPHRRHLRTLPPASAAHHPNLHKIHNNNNITTVSTAAAANTNTNNTASSARFSSKISPTDHPANGLLRFYLTPIRSSSSGKRHHKLSLLSS